MPFLEHLEEMRWRLFKSLITVFVLMLICWGFSDQLLEVLRYPGTQITPPLKMQVLKVQTVFMTKLEIALVAGIILFVKYNYDAYNLQQSENCKINTF